MAERADLAMSSSDSWPVCSPSFERGTVVILSTMSRRGLAAAAVQISPRFTHRRYLILDRRIGESSLRSTTTVVGAGRVGQLLHSDISIFLSSKGRSVMPLQAPYAEHRDRIASRRSQTKFARSFRVESCLSAIRSRKTSALCSPRKAMWADTKVRPFHPLAAFSTNPGTGITVDASRPARALIGRWSR